MLQVEYLVMKALSLGLVKGSIDQLSQEVSMTWVQPRVLDVDQVCDDSQHLTQMNFQSVKMVLVDSHISCSSNCLTCDVPYICCQYDKYVPPRYHQVHKPFLMHHYQCIMSLKCIALR